MLEERMRELGDGLRQFLAIVGWLAAGMVLGAWLAQHFAPGDGTALVTAMLLFPATVFLGWLLMLPLALLLLPFAVPGFLRWMFGPVAPPPAVPPPRWPRQATPVGWVFVLAAIPTSLVAGLVAGAPGWFLLAGLAYGYGLRRSAALQDVGVQ